METDCIQFKDTGYFSNIILDYLSGSDKLADFYHYKPELNSFEEAIQKKQFPMENRGVLVEALTKQYQKDGIKLNKFTAVAEQLAALKEEKCYTVTTGHQLCLFTGPLYFIYKIVSVIKLSRKLKELHPNKSFVPVYWMATEDHDFAEINHFKFQGTKIEWDSGQEGAVGQMSLGGLDEIAQQFSSLLTDYSSHAEALKGLFEKAYLKHDNLAAATRYLVNELFAEYGVVIVDGDDRALKQIFAPIVKEELQTAFSSKNVDTQSQQLAKDYKIQVNPREINLFYLTTGSRERIVKEGSGYFVNETGTSFTEEEILEELENYPERFSPNVLLRPLYQETILPNLAYVGGGGELAYWFQLKSTFEAANTPLPVLLLRNSAMWMDQKQHKHFKSLSISLQELFLEQSILLKEWVKSNAKEDLSLAKEQEEIKQLFDRLTAKAQNIDESLAPHVQALLAKQKHEVEQLAEKMIRAERRKATEVEAKIGMLKTQLFPNRGLQERTANFSDIYLREGAGMIDRLLNAFELPAQDFTVFYDSH